MDLKILNIAANAQNNREIKNFTHKSKYKNNLCGDQIEIRLVIKNDKIIDFGYQTESCVYCQASASILSKISINKPLLKVNKITIDTLEYFHNSKLSISKNLKKLGFILDKKNLSRKDCILLPFKALKNALNN